MKTLEEKIEEIKKINNDDSEFIESIYKYASEKQELNDVSNIIKSESEINNVDNNILIINVKEISKTPIWNTVMRRKISSILNQIEKEEIINAKNLKQIIKTNEAEPIKEEGKYTLDEVVNKIKETANSNKNLKVYYLGTEFTDEEIYIINELNKLITALKMEDNRLQFVYDTLCEDLDESFSKYNFCNFKNNKCLSQRHKGFFNNYPNQNKDGCCFNVYRKCKLHNKDGSCQTKCMACKLFTCPYLGKRGIGLYASEMLLIRAFFNKKQKKDLVWEFFRKKEKVLKILEKHGNV